MLRTANGRLEHQLTAVENENESIADFIELYRQQRSAVQARVAIKERECSELRTSRDRLKVGDGNWLFFNLLFQAGIDRLRMLAEHERMRRAPAANLDLSTPNDADKTAVSTTDETSSVRVDELMTILDEIAATTAAADLTDHIEQLTSCLNNSTTCGPDLHCSECRGRVHDL